MFLGLNLYLDTKALFREARYKELLVALLLEPPMSVNDLKVGFRLSTDAAHSSLTSAQMYLRSCLYTVGCGITENKPLPLYWLKQAKLNKENDVSMMIVFGIKS